MIIANDNFNYSKSPEETNMAYLLRVCTAKDNDEIDITWKTLSHIFNEELQVDYSESWYRKNYRAGEFGVQVVTEKMLTKPEIDEIINSNITTTAQSEEECDGNCKNCDSLDQCISNWYNEIADKQVELDNTLTELRKERFKLSDERSQNNAYLRRISREETIKEIANHYAEVMNKSLRLFTPVQASRCATANQAKEGILLLSDWHYGMVCDNSWNKFDPVICKQRVNKLLNKTIEYVTQNNLSKVTVLNLSDLIAGRIHTQIRIESRFDVITQTMEVSELLAEFLNNLSLHCQVDFYDCLDNHSRLEPNKNDSMDLESLVRIIPWYLKQRLSHNEFVHIKENEFGADIITCNILGHDIIGVHGDHDSPVTGLDKLTLMTHRHYDLFCTAHRHHFYMDEKNHAMIVGNSSLMGTDSYAEKLRLSSDPSQTFIIVSPENVCECIYRIIVK